ncbi:MAG: hypothetical protein FWJ90_17820 [Actinomadura sp.]
MASAERVVRGLLDRASPRRARQAGGPVPDQPRVCGGSGERLVEQHRSRTRLRRRDEPRRHDRRDDSHRRDGSGHPMFHARLSLLDVFTLSDASEHEFPALRHAHSDLQFRSLRGKASANPEFIAKKANMSGSGPSTREFDRAVEPDPEFTGPENGISGCGARERAREAIFNRSF